MKKKIFILFCICLFLGLTISILYIYVEIGEHPMSYIDSKESFEWIEILKTITGITSYVSIIVFFPLSILYILLIFLYKEINKVK